MAKERKKKKHLALKNPKTSEENDECHQVLKMMNVIRS
jgi:hypothetical protein